nr:MAG TPA_asm: hypothetical protein [Caudoviricetes sp.]
MIHHCLSTNSSKNHFHILCLNVYCMNIQLFCF